MSGDPFDPIWNRIVEMSRANNDEGYGEFVAKWPLEYYRDRLKQIGFEGFENVLDVGSGFGQWLVALATLNKRVSGIDVHEKRVGISNALIESLWLDNAEARVASGTELPFPDKSFDAVFCYGVFMFLDRDKALAEFHRVLRPGGVLHISTNARGWWLKLAVDRFRSNRHMAKVAWKAFWSGRTEGMPNSTDVKDVAELLARHGFENARAAGEARLTLDGTPSALTPHYDATYLGYDCVIDILASKPAAPPESQVAMPAVRRESGYGLLDYRIEEALEQTTYSFTRSLRQHPTLDTAETTYATKKDVVALARTVTAGIDRPAALRRIADLTAGGTKDQGELIRRFVTLSQKLFYHHFAVQPMVDEIHSLNDPLDVVIFRACRCGSSARFLVDLLASQNIDARLFIGACHTAAEVNLGGKWTLLDASLYPPGVFPLGTDGELLTIAELARQPELLDIAPSYINLHDGLITAFRADYPLMAKRIERYLSSALFPSVGYCASELGDPLQAGRLRHFRKLPGGTQHDPHYGWLNLVEEEWTVSPVLPLTQRPEPVFGAVLTDGHLRWEPARAFDGGKVVYHAHLSDATRGWNYDDIPVGCQFALPGAPSETFACQIEIPAELRRSAIYVSIVARRADRPDAFHLPSQEFVFRA